MRRWVLCAVGCALLALPLWGQRGGGGHGGFSGGGHGFSGGGGGYAAHGSAGYGYRGPVGGYRAPAYSGGYRPGYAGGYRPPAWNGNNWHGTGWNGNNWGWHGNGWGWRYPYRGYGWGWGYPGWGWNAGWGWGGWWWPGWSWGWNWSAWDNSYSYPVYAYPSDTYAASNYQAQNYSAGSYVTAQPDYNYPPDTRTQDEISRLQGEVDQLRSQQSAAASRSAEIHAQTVLVYRDGHTEEVQNYAIVGKTIWVFNESHARKVPLSDLDLAATRRDNEDRGIEFVVPNSR